MSSVSSSLQRTGNNSRSTGAVNTRNRLRYFAVFRLAIRGSPYTLSSLETAACANLGNETQKKKRENPRRKTPRRNGPCKNRRQRRRNEKLEIKGWRRTVNIIITVVIVRNARPDFYLFSTFRRRIFYSHTGGGGGGSGARPNNDTAIGRARARVGPAPEFHLTRKTAAGRRRCSVVVQKYIYIIINLRRAATIRHVPDKYFPTHRGAPRRTSTPSRDFSRRRTKRCSRRARGGAGCSLVTASAHSAVRLRRPSAAANRPTTTDRPDRRAHTTAAVGPVSCRLSDTVVVARPGSFRSPRRLCADRTSRLCVRFCPDRLGRCPRDLTTPEEARHLVPQSALAVNTIYRPPERATMSVSYITWMHQTDSPVSLPPVVEHLAAAAAAASQPLAAGASASSTSSSSSSSPQQQQSGTASSQQQPPLASSLHPTGPALSSLPSTLLPPPIPPPIVQSSKHLPLHKARMPNLMSSSGNPWPPPLQTAHKSMVAGGAAAAAAAAAASATVSASSVSAINGTNDVVGVGAWGGWWGYRRRYFHVPPRGMPVIYLGVTIL
ncbi:serine/threonine-protein kinase MARK2-like isoform X5 [Aphis craccivora]|uniref:Serine/threonine-protein kinase MARK2-like isoform X5 n=1 Tax=Aphis craccivora TaxID=307492 RepID=A0A6G0ZNV7_APHCR|nr:serine/threonine-protein kinase MARK2-like isoform X5 [Aphis craccivora]